MMITVSELEAIIAQTPPGEQVQYETKLIGSVDHVTRKLTELKLSRGSDLTILSLSGLTGSEMLSGGVLDDRRPVGISRKAREPA
jgi:hypothetical protein